jgi:H+-translocating NAD(P) transhydrogenase subunit alpha
MPIVVAVPKETTADECRVALDPIVAERFAKLGCKVLIECGAGLSAQQPDSAYASAEAVPDRKTLLGQADVLFKVQPPTLEEADALKEGAVVISFMQAHRNTALVAKLRDRKITSFAMELIPRISRAQSMDALSSQAAVAGYKAALMAASLSGRFFPMLTTAAGTIRPSKVLVIGAGVAGLQAIATAKRLGAMVEG